jgi:hypothetical protein
MSTGDRAIEMLLYKSNKTNVQQTDESQWISKHRNELSTDKTDIWNESWCLKGNLHDNKHAPK